jgi:flagellar biosynthesis anti-sigma factor FlgM
MKQRVLKGDGKNVPIVMMHRLHYSTWSAIAASVSKKKIKRFDQMDIKKLNTYISQPVQQPQAAALRNKAEQNDMGIRTETQDRVELSGKYKEVNELTKISMDRDEIRTEVVDRFRDLLKNNQYTIDPEKIADKMLSEIF